MIKEGQEDTIVQVVLMKKGIKMDLNEKNN